MKNTTKFFYYLLRYDDRKKFIIKSIIKNNVINLANDKVTIVTIYICLDFIV